MNKATRHEIGSGNVFADLGFSDAKEREVKTLLAMKIARLLERRKLSQQAAASLLGTSQARISRIVGYKLNEISLEKLVEFLTKLDQDVKITVKSKSKSHATGMFSAAVNY